MEDKFLSLTGLQRVMQNIYNTFALKDHAHTKSDISDFPNIPTATSQLTNDSGFITEDHNTTYILTQDGSTLVLTGTDGTIQTVDNSGSTIIVDSELSKDSLNPVENRVISAEIESINGQIAGFSKIDEITVELGPNGSVGGYETGDIISADTDMKTILNKLFRKSLSASYTKPKVSLAAQSTAAGSYEYGTNITAQVKATFTKNDAGAIQSISILKDGVELLTGTSNTLTSNAETFQLTSSVSYTASATYGEGAIKNNNLGEPSPDGHIAAGTVTSSAVTFTPYRQGYFYGVLTTDNTTPLTSEIIRSCNKKNGAYAAGNLPLISASSVSDRKRIFVACPATSKGVTKVVMPSAQGADATKDFVKQSSTVTVEGANGATGIAYNVWVYEPALISDDQTFTVTLG